MNRIIRYTLSAVAIIFLLTFSISSVKAESSANGPGYYYYYKIGAGKTLETELNWSSFTYGYYVTPSLNSVPLNRNQKHILTKASHLLSKLSENVTGVKLYQDQFSYGYEASGAWITDQKITDQIDLTLIGKIHYWMNSSRTTYIGLGGGYAYNELRDENRPDLELNVGGHVFSASELEVGTKLNSFDRPVFLTLTWAHRSNGGIEEDNTGINSLYLSLARRY